MRVLGILILLALSLPALAEVKITTRIHEVDYGRHMGEEILVLLTSGHVAKVTPGNKYLIDDILARKSHDEWYTFTLDDDRFIVDVDQAPAPAKSEVAPDLSEAFQKSTYVPTTVADMDTLTKYIREGRRGYAKEVTQCFNRAMVWSYEWWRKHSLKSMKILIFFTRNYIRRYNFEWWFHIAPYAHVRDENGKVVERVMDVKYTSRPHTFRQWTDIFMRNNAECNVITKYSEYADFPYTGECYIFRTNMYTYQPADLQMNEAWGYTKTSFNMDEVKAAFLEAFGIHL